MESIWKENQTFKSEQPLRFGYVPILFWGRKINSGEHKIKSVERKMNSGGSNINYGEEEINGGEHKIKSVGHEINNGEKNINNKN